MGCFKELRKAHPSVPVPKSNNVERSCQGLFTGKLTGSCCSNNSTKPVFGRTFYLIQKSKTTCPRHIMDIYFYSIFKKYFSTVFRICAMCNCTFLTWRKFQRGALVIVLYFSQKNWPLLGRQGTCKNVYEYIRTVKHKYLYILIDPTNGCEY